MPIRLLVADDHGIVREGLRMYLQWDKNLEIVGEAADGQEAVDQVSRLHPDIILMDILMPKMDGLQATAIIRKQFPETEVLVLTSVLDDAVIRQVIDSGAIGYLLKDTGSDELCRAIHAAAGGQVQLSREVARRLMSRQEDHPLTQPLTEREMDVLRQLALGRSNKEISLALSITEKTVKAHVGNILEKLGVSSRTQAALAAVHSGLVPLEDPPVE
jgi:DNA-binding NarL/FixJ family response regulator